MSVKPTETVSSGTVTEAAGLSQPAIGAAGLVIVGAAWFVLGVLLGGPQNSLEIVFPITTFALPLLVVSGLWWTGWPASHLDRAGAGSTNLVLAAVGAMVLTGIGQIVIGGLDVDGIFSNNTAIADGTLTSFPFTVPLAVAIFVAMLQLTFVLGKWPLATINPVKAGFIALLTVWVVGIVAYLVFANWDLVPPEARDLIGLRNPGGPFWALDFVGALVSIVVWQLTFSLLLGGWPFTLIESAPTRLAVSSAVVIGGGWVTYLIVKDGIGWTDVTIIGVCGSAVAAILLLVLVFETWPFATQNPALARGQLVATAVGLTAALFFGLKAVGNGFETWDRQPVELWIAASGLNYIGGPIIVHCLFFGRWPLTPVPQPE